MELTFKPSKVMLKVLQESLKYWYHRDTIIEYKDVDSAYYDFHTDTIVLGTPIMQDFYNNKVPYLSVYYHELAHSLYTKPLSDLESNWQNIIKNGSYVYDSKYHHLLNWIEDLYIESRLIKDYDYLYDVINCIKIPPVNYNILDIKYAFSYYYIYNKPSPTLDKADQLLFIKYIQKCLMLREQINYNSIISAVSFTLPGNQFIKEIVSFYNWCISVGIFIKDQVRPAQPNPMVVPNLTTSTQSNTNNVIKNNTNNNISNTQAQQSSKQTQQQSPTINNIIQNNINKQNVNTGVENISIYTTDVGTAPVSSFIIPKFNNPIILKKFNDEQGRFTSGKSASTDVLPSLAGIFINKYKPSSLITNSLNIRNYLNPVTRSNIHIFNKPIKSFNNVSIYRDISGSTRGDTHKQMDNIIKFLIEQIPIDHHFYLYASGKVSIIEEKYRPWQEAHKPPKEYINNPMFKQLGGGTNSGAIANVIKKQLSDKWLNIIVTDGDLYDLFNKQDINRLLENIFVIFVCTGSRFISKLKSNQYIVIPDDAVIDKVGICNKLLAYGGK